MASDTRSNLIDVATGQVRRRGYSAFSYADLAEAADLRKPSIHHHFPSKEDLGVAMVETYTERFSEDLARIDAGRGTALERLRAFARLYRKGLGAEQGCLCGVLASEIAVLPPRVQAGVRQFFQLNLQWLERTLEEGRSKRQLGAAVEPRRDARAVLAALEGALLVALSLQQPAVFDHAVDGLFAGLAATR
ncbi:MAG TPA: TetR/AcrR family transcriptional regulator [Usitatibacter sp.]|jgi:TetR/AcrR family transcriptional repressor of nem operon|nr:TetR/AcrR family transcriptional regulator [Usitatibacter sp.]